MRGLQCCFIGRHGGQGHGQFVCIRADGFKVVFVCKKGIGRTGEAAAEYCIHRVHSVFLPKKTVAATCSEIGHAQAGNAAHLFDFSPQPRLGPRIENVDLELAHIFEAGACAQFGDGREGIELPHGCLDPGAFKG